MTSLPITAKAGTEPRHAGGFADVAAVSFDFGGTLVRPDTRPTTGQIADVLGITLDDARAQMGKIAKRRLISPGDLAAEIALLHHHHALVGPLVQVLQGARQRAATPDLFEDAVPILKLLRARGFALYGMTNALGSSIPNEPPAFQALLDDVFASAETGACKPEREAFAVVERAVGLAPNRLLHVGDSVRADVTGALAAGWHAAYVQRSGDTDAPAIPSHVPRIRTLAALAHLLPTHA
ncbi:HAD family hydrolase [Embleya sp. NBC_00888]|uniref:HAD family hydrolase n=1 Tax=Embleya sp. NBC_00888 TaxID=2975960 RepID=UPI0038651166|nr:HAD family hydrolase [Embleya sp. NBC_00888]